MWRNTYYLTDRELSAKHIKTKVEENVQATAVLLKSTCLDIMFDQ